MTTPSSSHATTQQQEEQQGSGRPQVGLDDRDFEENTQLIRETAKGNTDAVTALLTSGANPNAQNIYGYTALLTALANGLTKVAQILLDFGASVHISTLEVSIGIFVVGLCRNVVDSTRKLTESMQGLSALHLAAIHCDETMMEKLLHCGAFLGAQDEEGDTLFHWAVREEKPEILSFLLSKAPTFLDTQNEDGETALHLAASLGEEETVETLLKNGASPAVKDNTGLTPAEHALDNSHYKIGHMLSKGRKGSKGSRHEPYRRSCGDIHGEYERKYHMPQHISSELSSPTHLC